MKDKKIIWVTAGYQLFAHNGLSGVKVEKIANEIGKSKSSFYHHFGDLPIFFDELLAYHLQQVKLIAEKEFSSNNIDPDIINVLVEFKTDLLFNRQLRVHRDKENFKNCFEKSTKIVAEPFLKVWVKDIGLQDKQALAELLFALVTENFFLQLTAETLCYEWLSGYFNNIKKMIAGLAKNNTA